MLHHLAMDMLLSLINEVKFMTLLQVVGGRYSKPDIRNVMVQKWLPTQEFRQELVSTQFHLFTVLNEDDHLIISSGTWDFIDSHVIIRKPWTAGEYLEEDPLPSIPQQVFIHNLLWSMWSEYAIAWICSALGTLISARALCQQAWGTLLTLEACVVIEPSFNYPTSMAIEVEGNEWQPLREVTLQSHMIIVNPCVVIMQVSDTNPPNVWCKREWTQLTPWKSFMDGKISGDGATSQVKNQPIGPYNFQIQIQKAERGSVVQVQMKKISIVEGSTTERSLGMCSNSGYVSGSQHQCTRD